MAAPWRFLTTMADFSTPYHVVSEISSEDLGNVPVESESASANAVIEPTPPVEKPEDQIPEVESQVPKHYFLSTMVSFSVPHINTLNQPAAEGTHSHISQGEPVSVDVDTATPVCAIVFLFCLISTV